MSNQSRDSEVDGCIGSESFAQARKRDSVTSETKYNYITDEPPVYLNI